MLQWYATIFGIGDDDIAEASWIADWIKRHHNNIRYDHASFRWFYITG